MTQHYLYPEERRSAMHDRLVGRFGDPSKADSPVINCMDTCEHCAKGCKGCPSLSYRDFPPTNKYGRQIGAGWCEVKNVWVVDGAKKV